MHRISGAEGARDRNGSWLNGDDVGIERAAEDGGDKSWLPF